MKDKLVLLLLMAPVGAVAADIVLSDPAQIQDAILIQESIDALSARVSQCIEKKLAEPPRCFCLYTAEFDNFKKAYAKAIEKHPEWKDKIVHFEGRNFGSTVGHNLGFIGLQRQANMSCEK